MSGIQQELLGGPFGAPAGYQIQRSLRFNSADDAHLDRTPASAGNRKTWTWSGWVKRSSFGFQALETVDDGPGEDSIAFLAGDTIRVYMSPVSGNGTVTDAVFRDSGAWYHIVVAVDTTQATAANRTIIYVNNVNVTSSSSNYITQNSDTKFNGTFVHYIGRYANQVQPSGNFDGYMTEINFIDGQALTPSDFGETDSATGVWKPKAYSGTYGTNGFYVNFSDNSNTTSTTLGKDYSGNGNNWTPTGFVVSPTTSAGNDSLVDTPTPYGTDTGVGGEVRGNYATWNPLDKNSNGSLLNGNLDNSNGSQNNANVRSTFALPSSGKWYAELRVNSATSGTVALSFGFATSTADLTDSVDKAGKYSIYGAGSGYIFSQTSTITSGLGAFSSGDILQIAYDGATGKAWLGKNNTWYNSTGGTTGDPGAGTNQTFTLSGEFFIYSYYYNVSGSLNCGQRPFAYTAPSGFKALCTQNLPTPTIGATSATQAGKYFNTVLYTGAQTTTQAITGVGFTPDWTWIKRRSQAARNVLTDVVRGTGKSLYSDSTDAEVTNDQYGYLTSFDSDGFTVNRGSGNLGERVNDLNATYVAWNWKANGAGSSNTSGTITSTVSANTTSGFSIVKYTGTGSNATVGHGCLVNGVATAPSFIICKERNTAGYDWRCYHASLGATKYIDLNATAAAATASTIWQDTAPTSTLFSIGTNGSVNVNTGSFIAYCFAPVAGYSAFGSYTGNGSSDGPFVFTGFRPRYILFKNSSAASGWNIFDTARDTYNAADKYLGAQTSAAESSGTAVVDILSNGFKVRNSWTDVNGSGNTIVYAAFAEFPFKYTLAR